MDVRHRCHLHSRERSRPAPCTLIVAHSFGPQLLDSRERFRPQLVFEKTARLPTLLPPASSQEVLPSALIVARGFAHRFRPNPLVSP